MRNRTKIFTIVFAVCATVFLFPNCVYADGASEKIAKQAYAQGLAKCYESGITIGKGDGDGVQSDYEPHKKGVSSDPQIPDLIEGFTSFKQMAPYQFANAHIYLPNGMTPEQNGNNNAKTNCSHLIIGKDASTNNGGDGFTDSVFARLGKAEITASSSNLETQMKNIGYEPDSSSGAMHCYHVRYRYTTLLTTDYTVSGAADKDIYYPNKICVNVDTDGYITDVTEEEESDTATYPSEKTAFNAGPVSGSLGFRATSGMNTNYFPITNDDITAPSDGNSIYYASSDKVKWSDAIAKLKSFAAGIVYSPEDTDSTTAYLYGDVYGNYPETYWTAFHSVAVVEDNAEGDSATANWKLMNRETAASNALKYVGYSADAGVSNTMLINDSQKAYLYQFYITGVAKYKVICEDDGNTQNYTKVKWFQTSSKREDCWISGGAVGANQTMFTAVDGTGRFSSQVTLSKIVEYLNAMSITKMEGIDDSELEENMAIPTSGSGVTEEQAELTCYTNAGSLGWILCPIINGLQDAIQNTYESMVPTFFVLDAELFKSGEASGTFKAWESFQGIANIAFTILFLFVIFSQLTGVGIDNYGVKKILPKLITAAILINLSYVICQLLIDISNIIGYGVKGLFEGIGEEATNVIISETGTGAEHSSIAAGGILAVLVAAICGGAVLAMGWGVLVPVLMALMSIAVAILTCFVLLSVRKGLAVVLVALSPLAFVCYMLPNTKKYFEKWKKSFQGVILLFPICSMLVFGGQMVARIIISANQGNAPFIMALSAAVISIIPIYYIPRVLRSSMGMVSDGIMNMGRGIRHGGRNRIRNSNLGQDAARHAQQIRDKRAAGFSTMPWNRGKNVASLGKRIGDRVYGNKNEQRNARIANARGRYIGALEDAAKNKDWADDSKFQNRLDARLVAAEQASKDQAIKNLEIQILNGENGNNINGLKDDLVSALRQGNAEEIKALTNVLTNKGSDGRDKVREAIMQTATASVAGGGISAEARKAFAENIMNNHAGTYKENSRSVFDFAKNAVGNGNAQYSENVKAGSLKGSQMNNMDDAEFDALKRQFMSGMSSIPETDKAMEAMKAIQGAAYEALHSENAGSMKQERKEDLERIVNGQVKAGNTLVDAQVGGSSVGRYEPDSVKEQRQEAQADRDALSDAISNAIKSSMPQSTPPPANSGLGNAGAVDSLKVGHPSTPPQTPPGGYKLKP